ncbi:MAG: hypothetical protein FWD55_05930, partial [Propionibacteriaceae bacterium]|nr:hypothetical protein [Propionibacteriaceae bacterium]
MRRILAGLLLFAVVGALSGCELFPTQGASSAANQTITLYLPNDDLDGFQPVNVIAEGTAKNIVTLLVDHEALPQGVALLDYGVNADGSGYADMNALFGQSVGEGTTSEYLRMGS